MPSLIQFTLQLDEPAPDNPALGLHALIYAWLDRADPAVARAVHTSGAQPLSLHLVRRAGFGSVLHADRRTVQGVLGVLDDTLTPLFEYAAAAGESLPVQQGDRLRGCVAGLRVQPLSWPAPTTLSVQGATLEFLTPVVLTGVPERPPVVRLYRGLLRRWAPFAPHPFPEDALMAATRVEVVTADTRTVQIANPSSRQAPPMQGVTGQIQVVFTDPRSAPLMAALTAVAPISGLGAKTLYGFGAVEVHGVLRPQSGTGR